MKQVKDVYRRQLTKRQLKLIDILTTGVEISEAMATCRISERILRKWTSSEAFNAELTYRQQLAEAQSKLLIGRFVPLAASQLINLLKSEKEETVRKTCLDILQLVSRPNKAQVQTAPKPPKITFSAEMAEKMLKLFAEESEHIHSADKACI